MKLYFRIPSVLAPFASSGQEGVSLVYFANSALWKEIKDPAPWHPPPDRLMIPDDWFRMMIVTIPATLGVAAMIDCPADAIAGASVQPAPRAGAYVDFLRRESVLAGKFASTDKGGSLAVAWRDAAGEVQLTALRHDGKKWRSGGKDCSPPAGLEARELYRGKLN